MLSSKARALFLSLLLLSPYQSSLLSAQTALPTSPKPTSPSLRGLVADPSDAVIPGATVTLTSPAGTPYTATSQSDGTYTVNDVPAGTYSFTVTMPGFAAFIRQGVRISSVSSIPTINAKLAVQDQSQVVNVIANGNTVSIDQDSNASATVLRGKDLDALSDDPDELSNELTALAGPAAGPDGGQIYIDGFTGGQLPPKSSIREIRVNQNPFSAQFDRVGFGRVEVFTKPGTDKFHGSAQINGSDRLFNTGSPFIGPQVAQPDYHSIFSFGSFTGPINAKASFALNGSLRKTQDNSIVNPPALFSTSQTAGIPCPPGTPGCSLFQTATGNGFTFANFTPKTRWDLTPRIDAALSEKNTLSLRYQYEHNAAQNQNIGGVDLFSTGYNTSSSEQEIQISDTQVFSAKLINETHFEYQRGTDTSLPFSNAPAIIVQGAFNAGGSTDGQSTQISSYFELQNYTSVALSKHFLRLGGRLRTTGQRNTSNAGQNGTFTYSSIADYLAPNPNCQPAGPSCTGILSQYSITHIASPTVSARATDVGLYAEDDWKVRPTLTVSYGLRFESQNFIHDQGDFAPRLSAAYALGKKTVLRAGAGVFYTRFNIGNEYNVLRNDGLNQQQSILSSNSGGADPIPSECTPDTPGGCPTGTSGRLITRTISPRIRAPYDVQANFGVDQQLFKGATISVNYQHIRGLHHFNSAVTGPGVAGLSANPGAGPSPGPTNPTAPIAYEYQSEGVFNQNQLVTNVNYRGFRNASFFGYYVLNFAQADTGGANTFSTVLNNLHADYGRASFDVRSRAFIGGSLTLPHLITLSPFLVAASGTPYNITSGIDFNGDTIFNDRAVAVAPGTPAPPSVATGSSSSRSFVKTIPGCGTFATPGVAGNFTPVPVNSCTGPANFTFNLRLLKTIGLGPSQEPKTPTTSAVSAGPSGPSLGPSNPGGGLGGPGGRGRGGFGGPPISSSHRYNLAIGGQVQNIFNVVNRNTPVGTLSSPSFGTSTQLAGNIFTTDSAVRRVSLQLSLSF